MTDSTIDTKNIYLYDRWADNGPGVAYPLDGFNGSSHHNVSSPAYPVGTKFYGYNDARGSKGRVGWYTMIYLQMGSAGSVAGVKGIAAKSIVAPAGATGSTAHIYRVSNAADSPTVNATGVGLAAVAIGSMTLDYYGWFWCGGVAPSDLITSGTSYVLDGTIKTGGDVAAGNFMAKGSASGETKLYALVNTADEVAMGMALAADA